MDTITPFLWFDGKAEEATKFYTSIFKNSKTTNVSHGGPNGAVMSTTFKLNGRDFIAFNGGPHFKFSPAISLFVSCNTQEEVNDLWTKLSKGGEKLQCGWLKDKFGVSWQIIPKALGKLLSQKDEEKSQRVMQAMLQMTKIEIKKLQRASDGK